MTTDSSGNFTFPSVTPEATRSLLRSPGRVLSSTRHPVRHGRKHDLKESFTVALGYTVSGTVSYSGSNTGQIYLALVPATGAARVDWEPASLLQDHLPFAAFLPAATRFKLDGSDRAGKRRAEYFRSFRHAPVTVVSSDLTGQSVTITDNTPTVVPSANPVFNAITPTDQGVAISYKPMTTNNVEAATSYDVQWSTDSTFATGTTHTTSRQSALVPMSGSSITEPGCYRQSVHQRPDLLF